jgi:hypothetical protein
MLTKQMCLVCLELAVVVGVIGCAPTLVSTDSAVYQNGKLYASSSKDLDAVYQATIQAMDKLQLKVTDKIKDVFAARVKAVSADNKIIIVNIKPYGDKKTEYTIMVGTLGDEERSRKIYTEIDVALSMAKGK